MILEIFFLNSGFICMANWFSIGNFNELYKVISGKETILADLMMYFSTGLLSAYLIFPMLNKKINIKWQLLIPFILISFPFFVTNITFFFINDEKIIRILLYAMSLILGLGSSAYLSINSSICYILGYKYQRLLNIGTGVSGVTISMIYIILNWLKIKEWNQLKVFMIVLLLYFIFAFIIKIIILKKYYIKFNDIIEKEKLDLESSKNKNYFLNTLNFATDYFFGLFLNIVITFSIVPNVINVIDFKGINSTKISIVNAICKFSDMIGKGSPKKIVFISDKTIRIYSIIRILFIVLFLYLSTNNYTNFLFTNTIIRFVYIILLGFTNGHLTAIMTGNAKNRFRNETEKKRAGYFMIMSWLGGLFYASIICRIFIYVK